MNVLKSLILKNKTRITDIVSYSTGNALSQLMNMLSGFLIIRALDKTEYGYYTIAFTIYVMLTQLSDIGVSIGLNNIGGRTWNDEDRFSSLIVTAESIRRRMILYVSFPIIIYGYAILLSNGDNILHSFTLLILVTVTSFIEIERLVLLTIPKYQGNLRFIRNNELIGSAAKLILVFISAFLFKDPASFLISFFLATAVQLNFLRKEKKIHINQDAKINNEFRTEIITYIKSNALNTFYYIFQGQLFILFLTVFGNVTNIAEIGALTKFNLIFSVINALFINYFIPDFAKTQGYKQIKSKFFKLFILILLLSITIIFLFALFPKYFLMIVGTNYYGLEYELFLVMLNSSFINIINILFLINSSKGWMNKIWTNVPITIILQIALLQILNVSNVSDIILFILYSQVPYFFVNTFNLYNGFKKIKFE